MEIKKRVGWFKREGLGFNEWPWFRCPLVSPKGDKLVMNSNSAPIHSNSAPIINRLIIATIRFFTESSLRLLSQRGEYTLEPGLFPPTKEMNGQFRRHFLRNQKRLCLTRPERHFLSWQKRQKPLKSREQNFPRGETQK